MGLLRHNRALLKRARRLGFTLLEVMVAIAILGLGLTAILSAQAGAFASSSYARNMSVAVGLARCKMSEVEEELSHDGFQELDQADSGPCCDDDENPNMTCSWRVEKLKLPEPQYGQLDLDTDLGNLGGPSPVSPGGLPPIPGLDADGGAPDIAGMMGTVISLVYPVMQTVLETSTRRITVTVTWREGNKDQSIEVMQWYANSSALLPDAGGAGAGGAGSTGGSTGSGSGR